MRVVSPLPEPGPSGVSPSAEPQLSIVVPVYNGARYLDPCIACLEALGEELPIEVIVQDACSTDGTTEKIRAVAERHPHWIHVVEKDNGQSDAINRGSARARAPWVTWLCADDILLPDFAAAFREGVGAKADIIYGDVVFIVGEGVHPAGGTEAHAPGVLARRRLVIQQAGTVVRTDVWRKAGGVALSHNWAMDYDLFLRFESMGCRFHRSRAFVAAAMLHQDAKTSSPSFRRVLEMWSIIGAAHLRNPAYFRVGPYMLYLMEYVIKNMEFGRPPGGHRPLLAGLHRAFWKLARPLEQGDIDARFAAERKRLEPLLAPLMVHQ